MHNTDKFLLVGLGNPGSEYQNTPHNIGFKAVDQILHAKQITKMQKKFKTTYAILKTEAAEILIAKPETYMNLSGFAVAELMRFYKIPTENVIVFYDDIDLPLGKIKIKQSGNSAGHKGIQCLDLCIGNSYKKVRIGVGRPSPKIDTAEYVLKKMHTDKIKLLDQRIALIAENLDLLLIQKFNLFMSRTSLMLQVEAHETQKNNNPINNDGDVGVHKDSTK